LRQKGVAFLKHIQTQHEPSKPETKKKGRRPQKMERPGIASGASVFHQRVIALLVYDAIHPVTSEADQCTGSSPYRACSAAESGSAANYADSGDAGHRYDAVSNGGTTDYCCTGLYGLLLGISGVSRGIQERRSGRHKGDMGHFHESHHEPQKQETKNNPRPIWAGD
jgi:hypothetical protein